MDSARDICGTIQHVLQSRGRTDVSDEFLRLYIGRHLFDLFLDLGYRQEEMDAMLADYREHYYSREHSLTRVYPGVAETLARLGGRKSTATTKGTPGTRAILERFGLLSHFDAVEIVLEKDASTYERMIEQFKIVKSQGWMVGNSPRSDINPALQVGLNAVFIPHSATWELEKAEIDCGTSKLLILSAFRLLRAHF